MGIKSGSGVHLATEPELERKPEAPPPPSPAEPSFDDLQKRVEEKKRELERDLEREMSDRRGIEERLREAAKRNKEIEEQAAVFQREAATSAEVIAELQQTLHVADQARTQLSAALERHGQELARWREESTAQKSRAEGLEGRLSEKDEALTESEAQFQEARKTFALQTTAKEAEFKRTVEDLRQASAQREKAMADLERRFDEARKIAAQELAQREAETKKVQADLHRFATERDKERGDMEKRRLELDAKRHELEADRMALDKAKILTEQAKKQAAQEVEQAKAEARDSARQAKIQIDRERRRCEDAAAAELASEKKRLQAHWDAQAKLSSQRQERTSALEHEHQRILAETQASLNKAEKAVAGLDADPAPADKTKKPGLEEKDGIWGKVRGVFKD